MKLADLLPERVREHAKAVVAMVVPAVSLYMTIRLNGNVSLADWIAIISIALSAGGFVAIVPNKLTLDQVNRYFDQTEDKYRGRFEWLGEDEMAVSRADFETPGEREARERMEQDEALDSREGKHRRE